jgi:hypothetical protein
VELESKLSLFLLVIASVELVILPCVAASISGSVSSHVLSHSGTKRIPDLFPL